MRRRERENEGENGTQCIGTEIVSRERHTLLFSQWRWENNGFGLERKGKDLRLCPFSVNYRARSCTPNGQKPCLGLCSLKSRSRPGRLPVGGVV